MSQNITDIDVSLNSNEENQLRTNGFRQIPVNLNTGNSGNQVFLWYKKSSGSAVTRIQLSFNNDMSEGLEAAKYQKIDKNLNDGAGGNPLYLWYFRGSLAYDVPITDLFISTDEQVEAQLCGSGWERQGCDMNMNSGGNRINLWAKRKQQTYICDITASNSFDGHAHLFHKGYIRVDESTNNGAGGAFVFIWFRHSTDQNNAIKDMKISTNMNEYQSYQQNGYQVVEQQLNEGSNGDHVKLWYKKDGTNPPIKTTTLINGEKNVSPYQWATVLVIEKNLNDGNSGPKEFLCFHQ